MTKEQKEEGDQVHVTACPLLDARTVRVSRRNSFVSFPAKPFGIEVKAREKRNYVRLHLDRLVVKKKKKVVIENGFSYTFLRFFFYTKSARFHSIYFVLILRKQRDFNKF